MPLSMHELVQKSLTLEYNDFFLKYPIQVVRGKPAAQELKVGGEFYGSTEK